MIRSIMESRPSCDLRCEVTHYVQPGKTFWVNYHDFNFSSPPPERLFHPPETGQKTGVRAALCGGRPQRRTPIYSREGERKGAACSRRAAPCPDRRHGGRKTRPRRNAAFNISTPPRHGKAGRETARASGAAGRPSGGAGEGERRQCKRMAQNVFSFHRKNSHSIRLI